MSTPHVIDNEGIGGGPFLTMAVSETGGFIQDDLDGNLTACAVTANNEVGKATLGARLFGKVVWVSTETVEGTTRPVSCAVQARGVARFAYVAPAPVVNRMVELAGGGKVTKSAADADIEAGGPLSRGQVIAVDSVNQTCDVWLG